MQSIRPIIPRIAADRRGRWRRAILARAPAAIIAALAAAHAALAQDAASSTPPAPPETVHVAGARADQRQRDTTTSIVIEHADIVRHGDQTLADVLKRLPGVSVSGAPGQGGAISLRGLGQGYTQILLDGQPVAAGFSLDAIAPELIERIEILRGATAELSNQAIAGAINIILRKAVARGQRAIGASVAARPGRAGTATPALTAQLSDRDGGYSYSLAATLARQRDETPSVDLERQNDARGTATLLRRTPQTESARTTVFTLAPRLNWRLGDDETQSWQSLVNLRRMDNRHRADETTIVGAASAYPHNDARFQADFIMLRSDLEWSRALADGARLEMKLGASGNRRGGTFDFTGRDADGRPAGRHHVDSGPSETAVTASGTYRHPVGARHALALGWDASHALRREDRDETVFSADGVRTGGSDADYSANVNRLALFAQDEWQVTDRYSLYLGLRHERLDTASRANTKANASASTSISAGGVRTGPDALDTRSAVWSPSLQSRYQLADKDVLRLALSRGYKAPPLSRLVPRRYTSDNNNNPTNPDEQGNPDLRPELAWGLDAAYEHYLGDGALLAASAYLRRIRDVTQTRLFEQDGVWVEAPFNNGRADVRGVELEAKLPLRALLPGAPALDVRANLARNWSRVERVPGPDNRLETQVPFTANLGVDYRVPDSALTAGGNLNLQGGGTVRQSAWLRTATSAKRELDLYLLWKATARTQWRFSASNLLRRQASESREVGGVDADGGTHGRLTLTPTGATVRIMLEHRLP